MGGRQQTRSAATVRHPWIVACLLLAATCTTPAQTLARPGWAGSGLNADPWWKQAVFYRIAASPADRSHAAAYRQGADFKAIAARLDALHSLGVDALLLPMPTLPSSLAPDPALDDFDELIHQASRRGIRVLLSFSVSNGTADLSATARFWLSRGVAGFHLGSPPGASLSPTPQDSQAIVQALRKITGSAVGSRIVISDFNPNVSATPLASSSSRQTTRSAFSRRADRPRDSADAQLQIDPRLAQLDLPEAANLRPLLAQSLLTPNLLLDFHPPAPPSSSPDPYPALAHVMAAILLTTHSAALIDADESLALQPDTPPAPPAPPAPDAALPSSAAHSISVNRPAIPSLMSRSTSLPAPALADWYSKLSALHHGNATLRYGSVTLLNFDSQNALVWVSRPASGAGPAPPVVVACNLSSSPVQLSLTSAIRGLSLRGTYLLTLLRSGQAMGPQDLNSVTLPPFGVYIGELHR
jgi:alpha-glucosidase